MKYMPATQTIINKKYIGRPFQSACVHIYLLKESVSLSNVFVNQEISVVGQAERKYEKGRGEFFSVNSLVWGSYPLTGV